MSCCLKPGLFPGMLDDGSAGHCLPVSLKDKVGGSFGLYDCIVCMSGMPIKDWIQRVFSLSVLPSAL